MNYVARRFRQAGHVGGVRRRLAAAIVKKFAERDIVCTCEPDDLHPALGRWRTDTSGSFDCMPWNGWAHLVKEGQKPFRISVDSWDRMTTLLKGFDIEQGDHAWEYQLNARHELPTSERFKR